MHKEKTQIPEMSEKTRQIIEAVRETGAHAVKIKKDYDERQIFIEKVFGKAVDFIIKKKRELGEWPKE